MKDDRARVLAVAGAIATTALMLMPAGHGVSALFGGVGRLASMAATLGSLSAAGVADQRDAGHVHEPVHGALRRLSVPGLPEVQVRKQEPRSHELLGALPVVGPRAVEEVLVDRSGDEAAAREMAAQVLVPVLAEVAHGVVAVHDEDERERSRTRGQPGEPVERQRVPSKPPEPRPCLLRAAAEGGKCLRGIDGRRRDVNARPEGRPMPIRAAAIGQLTDWVLAGQTGVREGGGRGDPVEPRLVGDQPGGAAGRDEERGPAARRQDGDRREDRRCPAPDAPRSLERWAARWPAAPRSAKTAPVARMYGDTALAGRKRASTPVLGPTIPRRSAPQNAPSQPAGSPSMNLNGMATTRRTESGARRSSGARWRVAWMPRPSNRISHEISNPTIAPARVAMRAPVPDRSTSSGHGRSRNIAGPLSPAAIRNATTDPHEESSSSAAPMLPPTSRTNARPVRTSRPARVRTDSRDPSMLVPIRAPAGATGVLAAIARLPRRGAGRGSAPAGSGTVDLRAGGAHPASAVGCKAVGGPAHPRGALCVAALP